MIRRPPDFDYPNPYEEVDQVLGPWAEEHDVRVSVVDRDDEVRTFDVRNSQNRKYQVWIDRPAKDDKISVHLWRRDSRGTITFAGALSELRKNLDLAFDWATGGRPTGQSTRLPPPKWIQTLLRWLGLDRP